MRNINGKQKMHVKHKKVYSSVLFNFSLFGNNLSQRITNHEFFLFVYFRYVFLTILQHLEILNSGLMVQSLKDILCLQCFQKYLRCFIVHSQRISRKNSELFLKLTIRRYVCIVSCRGVLQLGGLVLVLCHRSR